MRGELSALPGDDAGAEEQLRRRSSTREQQEARSFELRAATALAKLLTATGRTAEARERAGAGLRVVHRRARHGDLVAARTLLSEVG